MFKKWIGRHLHPFRSVSTVDKKRKWISMTVDRVYFEQQTDRFFMVLKTADSRDGRRVFLSIGNVLDESILPALFLQNDNARKLLRQVGVRVRRIRILKKTNSADSAECVLKVGFFSKTARISNIEAVRLSAENNTAIEVPEDILRAEKFDIDARAESFGSLHNNVFSFKFLDRDINNNQEVIM